MILRRYLIVTRNDARDWEVTPIRQSFFTQRHAERRSNKLNALINRRGVNALGIEFAVADRRFFQEAR